MTHAEGADRLLRIDDVAELANVSRDTVHRWITRGLLVPIGRTPPGPSETRPGSARFTRAQVIELLRHPEQDDDPPTNPDLATDLLGRIPQ